MAEDDIRPCNIRIDKEGKWFYMGIEMIKKEIINDLYRYLDRLEDGRYILNMNGQRCIIEVEDCPFVVVGVNIIEKRDKSPSAYILKLNDDGTEELIPETLFIGKENVPYCMVKRGRFQARFSRPAYYQISSKIEERGGIFYLPLKDKRYMIEIKS